jgi:tetratricopeptide (TPR) repeat protein
VSVALQHVERAAALRAAGDPRGALSLCDAVLAERPTLIAALRLRAECLVSLGRPVQAGAAWERALAVDAGDLDALAGLASTWASLGEMEDAAAAWARASDRARRRLRDVSRRTAIETAACEAELAAGAFEAAAARARAVLDDRRLAATLDADAKQRWLLRLSEAELRLRADAGAAAQAAAAARQAAEDLADPHAAETHATETHATETLVGTLAVHATYGGWAGLEREALDRLAQIAPPAAERMARASSSKTAGRPVGVELACKRLGRDAEHAGDFKRARELYALANAAADRGRPPAWSADEHDRTVDALIDACAASDPSPLAAAARRVHEDQSTPSADVTPVFVVGVPRSGTTLIERIIGAHPAVFARGELQTLTNAARLIAEQTGAAINTPAFLARTTPELAAAAAAWRLAAQDRAIARRREPDGSAPPRPSVVTDKMPANFLNMHVIERIAPTARIVWCVRDPRDLAVSCWTTAFAGNLAWARDLGLTQRYIRAHDRLLAFWSDRLGDRLLVVRYEDVISDQSAQSRRLLAHCGLDWSDDVLRFWERGGRVLTASHEQATRPVYTTSMGRADRLGVLK